MRINFTENCVGNSLLIISKNDEKYEQKYHSSGFKLGPLVDYYVRAITS